MKEIWKPIPKYVGFYEASNLGRIRRVFRKKKNPPFKVLAKCKNRYNYEIVHLSMFNKAHPRTVHQLVLEAFIGPRPQDKVTNHKDGNRSNNKLSNLEYCTRSENTKHAWHTLGRWRYAFTPTRKGEITAEIAKKIKLFIKQGMRVTNIVRTLNVSRYIVSDIKRGRTWKSVMI